LKLYFPTESELNEATKFIMTEASDYQIISMILEGSVPQEYTSENEIEIFKKFNSLFETNIIPVYKYIPFLSEQKISEFKSVNVMKDIRQSMPMDVKKRLLAARKAKPSPFIAASKYAKQLKTSGKDLPARPMESTQNIQKSPLAVVSIAIYNARKQLEEKLNRSKSVCDKSKSKRNCMLRGRVLALRSQSSELQKGISKCSETNNREKCSSLIRNKIRKIKENINSLLSK
jgi:hypothetical protein